MTHEESAPAGNDVDVNVGTQSAPDPEPAKPGDEGGSESGGSEGSESSGE
jgi:hypothetical protein